MRDYSKPLRWGILSTGRIADWFCTDFHMAEGSELAAVASRSQENADGFAAKYDIPAAYGDYDQMLADETIDVIYIGTPHTNHLEAATKALEAGKAVLCEKPITVSPDECKQLIETAERTGSYLMEAVWTYFLPAIRKAQQWVADGRIGELIHVKADFGYPVPYSPDQREYDTRLGGGVMLEMGVYPIAINWLFQQQEPRSIHVIGRTAPNGAEDDVVMTFDYPNSVSSLATSFKARLRNSCYLIGTEGYIEIPDFFRAFECRLYHLDDCIKEFKDGRETLGYHYQAEAVTADLRAGKRQSDIVPLSASLKFQEHMAAVLIQANRASS